MELGALVCVPEKPLCLVCPVSAECRLANSVSRIGFRSATAKAPPQEVAEACALVEREGSILIVKRGDGAALGAFLGVPDDPPRRRRPGGPVSGRRWTWPRGSAA